jgi:hypothetical protein
LKTILNSTKKQKTKNRQNLLIGSKYRGKEEEEEKTFVQYPVFLLNSSMLKQHTEPL